MSDYNTLHASRHSDMPMPWTQDDVKIVKSAMVTMHQESYAAFCALKGAQYNPLCLERDTLNAYDALPEHRKTEITASEYVSMCMHHVMYVNDDALESTKRSQAMTDMLADLKPLKLPGSAASPTCSHMRLKTKAVSYYALSEFHDVKDYGVSMAKLVATIDTIA